MTRAERRRATEARILDEARTLFAERGFDRTTVRAVASAAEVDPALVMKYFGSKRALFEQAVRAPVAVPEDVGDPVEHLLVTLGVKLGGLPEEALATMRSMLTDPDAAGRVRETFGAQIEALGATIPGEDAELRAALALSTVLGVTIGHQLLELPALDASGERIADLLRPVLRSLTRSC